MSYPTNDQFITVTTKRTIPDQQTALTGTVSAVAGAVTVVGVGTIFQTEIGSGISQVQAPSKVAQNGFLVDLTNSELRRVSQVIDDTTLLLESGFTNALAGATIYYVPSSKAKFMGITCNTATVTVNGATLPAGQSINYGNENDSTYVVDPLLVDASGGSASVTIQYAGR